MKKWLHFLSIMALFLAPHANGWSLEFEDTPRIVLKGEASIFQPADQMEVSLGVLTVAENSSEAMNENNQRVRKIIENLKALGLDESDYQTGRFSIRPIYQKPPKDSERDDHAVISKYEVINAVKIKTQKIDLADKILNAAVQGGANQIDQINFNLSNPQAYRDEAIKLATQNVLADANALANAAGVKIIRILYLSLDQWQQIPTPLMINRQKGSFALQATANEPDVITPGQTEIHATVNAGFEISPK